MKTKKEFIIKALENETIKNNLTMNQVNAFINGNTRNKFDNLTIEKNHRKLFNMLLKKALQFKEARDQKEVKKMVVSIIWERGSMQAMQTRAEVQVFYKNGSFNRFETSKTGGWGYDKESTTLSQVFNQTLLYKIVDDKRRKKAPYGINKQERYFLPSYSYGIGTSCYYSICEYIGGKMELIASTSKTNTYIITIK